MADNSAKKAYRLILLWYFLFFFYDCITSTYWVKFLRFHGMTPSDVGNITAAAWLCSLLLQPFWAATADKAHFKNTPQRLLLIGSVLSLALLFLPIRGALIGPFLLLVYILFQAFQTPSFFLSDTIALETLDKAGKPFGRARLMGSIGWSVSGLLIGLLLEKDVRLFAPVAVLMGFALLLLQRGLPKVQGHMAKTARSFRAIGQLLSNRAVYPVLMAEALLSFAGSLSGLFLLAEFERVGGTTGVFGVFVFLATMTELPYLFFGDKIVRRFGTRTVLGAVGIVSALRLFFLYWMPSWPYLFVLILVQGLLVLRLYSMTVYINSVSPPHLKAAGQMLYATTAGAFRAAGAMAGGLLVEKVFAGDYAKNFLLAGILCLMASLWLWISLRKGTEGALPVSEQPVSATEGN